MKHLSKLRYVFIIITMVILHPADTQAGPAATQGLYVNCDALTGSRLKCRFRLREPLLIKTIEASVAGQTLPSPKFTPFGTGADDTSVFFFLIDSSNPLRQKTVERNIAIIRKIIDQGGDRRLFGLGAFDSRLRVLAPVAPAVAAKDAVIKALQSIKADGQATELYRSVLEAVELLEKTQAARKALIVFSDGKKEDTAYTRADVIIAALRAKVVIYGLGYAEKKSDTPHLQHLRRLAEETGGPYFSADIATGKLPAALLKTPFAFLENGGRAEIDLSGLYAEQTLKLVFKTMDGNVFFWQKQIVLPPAPAPAPAAELSAIQRWRAWVTANPVSSALAGIAVLSLLIALLLFVAERWRRQSAPEEEEPEPEVLAALEFLDGDMSRADITTAALRIGRNPDNDLCLTNDSVSGYHAELHRNRQGRFHITDLDSSNGILINEEPQTQHTLADGDVIALGEVRFRFALEK